MADFWMWSDVPPLSLVRDPAGRTWIVADKAPVDAGDPGTCNVLLVNSDHRRVERIVEPWEAVDVVTTELAHAFILLVSFPGTRAIGRE